MNDDDGTGRSTSAPPTADGPVFGRQLFDDHARSLRRYLVSRVGAQAADDLVAETFLNAVQHQHRYDARRGSTAAWLFGIATNLVRRHHRQEQRALSAVSKLPDPLDDPGEGHAERVAARVDAQIQVSRLAAEVLALPDRDRDVLLLTAWAGLSSSEVAAALGVPVGTVRSRLHRVRSQLRDAIPPAQREDGASQHAP